MGRARREEAALRADIEEFTTDFWRSTIRHAPVSALSYGLQKRVEMARASYCRTAADPDARRTRRRHEP